MDTRIVSCKLCLQSVHIDTTWCVIEKKKRFYECKDVGLCKELRQHNFKKPQPSAPPQPQTQLEIQPPCYHKLEIQPPCYHKSSTSIIKILRNFLFPRYNEYSYLKTN